MAAVLVIEAENARLTGRVFSGDGAVSSAYQRIGCALVQTLVTAKVKLQGGIPVEYSKN